MNGAERRDFVRAHRTCVFGYARKAHGPSMSVVYYVMDGDDILVSTMIGRAKAKAVSRNPQVSLCILDEKWPPTYLLVYGTAKIEEQGGEEMMAKIVELMAGQPMPPAERERVYELARKEGRVVVRVTPESTFESPPRHVYQPDDVKTLSHGFGATLPWGAD